MLLSVGGEQILDGSSMSESSLGGQLKCAYPLGLTYAMLCESDEGEVNLLVIDNGENTIVEYVVPSVVGRHYTFKLLEQDREVRGIVDAKSLPVVSSIRVKVRLPDARCSV